MHQAGVFLFCLVLLLLLVLVLATRMLRERRDGRGQYSCAHEQNCKFVSHLVLAVGQAPCLPAGNGNWSGCPTIRIRLRLHYARKAVHERGDSAAESIQQMKTGVT